MRQWQRYGEHGPRSNADLKGGAVARHCRPDADGRRLLTQAVQAFGLSARGYARVLKVARTIGRHLGMLARLSMEQANGTAPAPMTSGSTEKRS